MLYHDGKKVKIGDRASIDTTLEGTVVISFDDNATLPNHKIEDWGDDKGVLVIFDNGSRLYIEDNNNVSNFFLIARQWLGQGG